MVGRRSIARVGLVAVIAAAGAVTIGVAGPAGAAFGDGEMFLRGSGSTYAQSGAVVAESVKPGKAATFSIKIVNTSEITQQFILQAQPNNGEQAAGIEDMAPAAIILLNGKSDITEVAESDDGYYTPALDPGESVTLSLTLRIESISAIPGQRSADVGLNLYSRTGISILNELAGQTAVAVYSQTSGAGDHDVYITTSGEAAVSCCEVSGAALKRRGARTLSYQSATYTIKARNDSNQPAVINVSGFGAYCDNAFTDTVKIGSSDVTSVFQSSAGYSTALLNHGQSVTFVLTRAPNLSNICTSALYDIQVSSSSSSGYDLIGIWSNLAGA